MGYDRRAAEAENSVWKTAACGFAGSPQSHRLFIWLKTGPGRRKEITVFTPVNITPLSRRGSPLALTPRGILVAAVAMTLLVTIAVYPLGSRKDTGSPYRIPWEETLGASLPLGLSSLDPVGVGTGRARTGWQAPGQAVALSDLESQMWEAINGERANAGLPLLAIDGRLVGLARERSNDMMTRGYFSHTRGKDDI